MRRKRQTTQKHNKASNGNGRTHAIPAAGVGPAVKVIAESAFKNLCNQLRNAQRDAEEARGTIGGLISQACETKHLHKKAFALFRTLNKLSDAHLMTTLTHFDHYREIGGLDERATRQSEMLAERPELRQITHFQGEAMAVQDMETEAA